MIYFNETYKNNILVFILIRNIKIVPEKIS